MKFRIVKCHAERAIVLPVAAIFGILAGCSPAQTAKEPPPDVRINLSAHGLPQGFFRADADKCAHEIISYRFVVWLDNESVAVGFSTSPNCRVSPDLKVDGVARLLTFGMTGELKAKRDIPYLADGNGEIVAEGEARPGPGGTLLFRIDSVNLDKEGRNESKSGLLLLDAKLQDVAQRVCARKIRNFSTWNIACGKALYLVCRKGQKQ